MRTASDLARDWKVAPSTVYAAHARGELVAVRIGRSLRFSEQAVNDYIAAHTVSDAAQAKRFGLDLPAQVGRAVDRPGIAHGTMRVRGLLCRVCNTRLGVLENVTGEWIERSEAYIGRSVRDDSRTADHEAPLHRHEDGSGR